MIKFPPNMEIIINPKNILTTFETPYFKCIYRNNRWFYSSRTREKIIQRFY